MEAQPEENAEAHQLGSLDAGNDLENDHAKIKEIGNGEDPFPSKGLVVHPSHNNATESSSGSPAHGIIAFSENENAISIPKTEETIDAKEIEKNKDVAEELFFDKEGEEKEHNNIKHDATTPSAGTLKPDCEDECYDSSAINSNGVLMETTEIKTLNDGEGITETIGIRDFVTGSPDPADATETANSLLDVNGVVIDDAESKTDHVFDELKAAQSSGGDASPPSVSETPQIASELLPEEGSASLEETSGTCASPVVSDDRSPVPIDDSLDDAGDLQYTGTENNTTDPNTNDVDTSALPAAVTSDECAAGETPREAPLIEFAQSTENVCQPKTANFFSTEMSEVPPATQDVATTSGIDLQDDLFSGQSKIESGEEEKEAFGGFGTFEEARINNASKIASHNLSEDDSTSMQNIESTLADKFGEFTSDKASSSLSNNEESSEADSHIDLAQDRLDTSGDGHVTETQDLGDEAVEAKTDATKDEAGGTELTNEEFGDFGTMEEADVADKATSQFIPDAVEDTVASAAPIEGFGQLATDNDEMIDHDFVGSSANNAALTGTEGRKSGQPLHVNAAKSTPIADDGEFHFGVAQDTAPGEGINTEPDEGSVEKVDQGEEENHEWGEREIQQIKSGPDSSPGKNEFGDFGSFPEPVLDAPGPQNEFVEFESPKESFVLSKIDGQTVDSISDVMDGSKVSGAGASNENSGPPASQKSPEEDEFGDFGSFSEPALDASEHQNEFGEFASSKDGTVLSKTDKHTMDSRSDVADENKVSGTGTANAADETDEDEFGDFGTFTEAKESDNRPRLAKKKLDEAGDLRGTSEEEEDEFGEFGSFCEPTSEVPSDAIKDAGPPEVAVASPTEDKVGGEVDGDEEFGEFGDFESVTPREQTTRHSSEPSENAPPPSGANGGDSFLANSQLVFDKVFGRDMEDESGDDIHENTQERVAVSRILGSCPPCRDTRARRWSRDGLASNLDLGAGKEDALSAVVVNNCIHSYTPFSFRIGGLLSSSEAEFREGVKRRQEQTPRRLAVPDVFAIKIANRNSGGSANVSPTKKPATERGPRASIPASRKSNQSNNDTGNAANETTRKVGSRSSPATGSSAGGTIVALPPAKKPIENRTPSKVGKIDSNKAGESEETQVTDAARRLMGQIPDLSFMVKTTFCPPDRKRA